MDLYQAANRLQRLQDAASRFMEMSQPMKVATLRPYLSSCAARRWWSTTTLTSIYHTSVAVALTFQNGKRTESHKS